MSRIGVILGSTRPNRISPEIGQWAVQELSNGSELDYEIIDLKDLGLPVYDEPQSPRASNDYQNEHTKKWSALANSFDGFVLILPEYNGSIPGVLKNALDYLYQEWEGKPVAYVSYGFGSGANSAAAFEAIASYYGFKLVDKNAKLQLSGDTYGADGKLLDPAQIFGAQAADVKAIDAALKDALAAS
ncbi:putative flavoprotein [Corynebacterium mustelae]|uniref:Putative flavoprotein n=1 Tax=Corynebacterium mustelae TaxID=571915 RepID=A0A0G3GWS0_9CORY|nr:NAD(P)H-dependent oxidoreductase [Corynebacterium mustelae]AKK04985.1 putative flavoprotein [Corynebacterium mustelae]